MMMYYDVTITISTKGRYETTLPLCLTSIINQTVLPKKIILVDDNEVKKFYDIEIFKYLLLLMKLKNIEFQYFYGESKGQVYAQKIAFNHCNTKWIFKIDDDNILENNVLELLTNQLSDNVGGISGLILNKKDFNTNRKIEYESDIYNEIKNIFKYFNIQFCLNQDDSIKKVEHIYSNYLVRKDLIEFSLEFSPAGHREDTVITHQIFRKGYDLLIVPKSITWHLESSGGNRNYDYNLNVNNEKKFLKKLNEWGIHLDIKEDEKRVYEIKDGEDWLIYEKDR